MHEYHSALDCSYSCMQVKRFGIKVSNISEMTLTLQKLSLRNCLSPDTHMLLIRRLELYVLRLIV